MRIKNTPTLALALMLVGSIASIARPAAADDVRLSGTWKLVALPFGDDEFAILKLVENDGKTSGSVADAQQMMGRPQVKSVEHKDGLLTLNLDGAGGNTVFKGRLPKDGAGKFLGMLYFRGRAYPARLETTTDSKVGPLKQSPLIAKLQEVQNETDPKSKLKKLEEAINGNHGSPSSSLLYAELLSSAQAAGLEVEKVNDLVKRWAEEAKPYGASGQTMSGSRPSRPSRRARAWPR